MIHKFAYLTLTLIGASAPLALPAQEPPVPTCTKCVATTDDFSSTMVQVGEHNYWVNFKVETKLGGQCEYSEADGCGQIEDCTFGVSASITSVDGSPVPSTVTVGASEAEGDPGVSPDRAVYRPLVSGTPGTEVAVEEMHPGCSKDAFYVVDIIDQGPTPFASARSEPLVMHCGTCVTQITNPE